MKMLTIYLMMLILGATMSCGLQTRVYNNPVDPDCKDADNTLPGEGQCPQNKPAGATAGAPTQTATATSTVTATSPTVTVSSTVTTSTSTSTSTWTGPTLGFGDGKALVQTKVGKPDSTNQYGSTDTWDYTALANSQYGTCGLTFDNGTLSTFDVGCKPAAFNFLTFGDTATGAATPESGKSLSKNISKTAVYQKWGTPDSINFYGTTQNWNYSSEANSTYGSCELTFDSGLLTSTDIGCKTTDIDVTTF